MKPVIRYPELTIYNVIAAFVSTTFFFLVCSLYTDISTSLNYILQRCLNILYLALSFYFSCATSCINCVYVLLIFFIYILSFVFYLFHFLDILFVSLSLHISHSTYLTHYISHTVHIYVFVTIHCFNACFLQVYTNEKRAKWCLSQPVYKILINYIQLYKIYYMLFL